jgi:hypothetical protein
MTANREINRQYPLVILGDPSDRLLVLVLYEHPTKNDERLSIFFTNDASAEVNVS